MTFHYYYAGISHYRRPHAPHRLYVDPSLSIAELYNAYEIKCKSASRKCLSRSTFNRCVHSMNISFAKLGHEECEVCLKHREHSCPADAVVKSCKCCSKKPVETVDECRCCKEFCQLIGKIICSC